MIGSSLNQMVTAEKMSVDQLRQSIENGTVEAYIGIPLLQSKLKDQQQAQAMQQPVESPPIAQEIMSQAAGVSQLQSNLPTEQYQDGGIVSLAGGGDEFFLDEDDPLLASQEEEEYTNAVSGLFNAAQGIAGMANLPTKAMSAYENVTPDVERETLRAQSIPQKAPQQAPQQMTSQAPQQMPQQASGAPQQMTSQAPQSGINDLISAAAERNSVPSDLLMNIAGAESSGRSDAANPRSSAKGVFQFIDSTWESLGGTPGNQFDPQENVELGARFTRQNAERLKQELGRDPSYAETYAAHYFGPGVSSMLKNADPSDPIEVGLATFTNSRGVDQILRANPNLQGKTVGEVMSSLVAKAGEGIVQLAGGGPIRFNEGDVVESSEDLTGPFGGMEDYGFDLYGQPLVPEATGPSLREILTPESMKDSSYYKTGTQLGAGKPSKAKTDVKPKPETKATPKPGPEVKTNDLTALKDTKTSSEDITKLINKDESTQKKTEDFYDLFLKDYMDSKSDKDRQRKMDAYTALATAGFAAAAGSSPNPLQNISQGALAGMGQYAGSQKTRAAEGLAEQKNLLSAQRYRELGEAARATAAMTEVRLTAEEKNRFRNLFNNRQEQLEKIVNDDKLLIGNEPAKQQKLQNLMLNDPMYNELFKSIYGVNYSEYVQQQSGQKEVNTSGYLVKPK